MPAKTLQNDRAADHVAAEARSALAVLDSHRSVGRETAVAPGQEVVDSRLGDELLVEQHPQHLGAKQPLDVTGVEPGERPEGAVRREAAVRHQHVDMRVEVQKLSRGLQEPSRARGNIGAVKVGSEVELQGSPGTAGELTQKPAVVAEEDPKPLGNRGHDLAMGNFFEQLLLGPVRPQELRASGGSSGTGLGACRRRR